MYCNQAFSISIIFYMVSEHLNSNESDPPSTASESIMASQSIIQINAATHFNTTLTSENFPVWRKQVQSTLIGFDLAHFVTGSKPVPAEYLDAEKTKPNPEFSPWYRQDQIILAALIGSCKPTIQSLIASAETSQQAWERLVASYANSSRSRIISLKSKLASNLRGNRPVAEYLRDMKSIADELALVQSPVTDEDLMIHILRQLGEEYKTIAISLSLLDTKITFPVLFEKLVDFERDLTLTSASSMPIMTTANYTQRQSRSGRRGNYGNYGNSNIKSARNQWSSGSNSNGGNRDNHNRNNLYCQYCHFSGHEAKECRKLARFLKENQVTPGGSMPQNKFSPTANITTSPYMFDTGASHHVDPNRESFHSIAEYGGPDEIVLGNGSSHGGTSNEGGELP